METQENVSVFQSHTCRGPDMYEAMAVAMESQLTGHSSVCPTGCPSNPEGHMKVRVHEAFSFHEITMDENRKR